MKRTLTSLTITMACLALSAVTGLAESRIVQNHDGTSGHLSHLGDDIGIYSDPHGNQTIVTKPGTESPIGLQPHGETESGNRSTFGTPLPPNNLTPAPILPLSPNRALSPAPSPNSHTPPSGGGRFGR
ncbi:MAG: hypothetical protein Q7U39_05585 [Nitrospira sp.]|nr:hypothetical protein [Nitrospira sp.]